MSFMEILDLKEKWEVLITKLEKQFGEKPDLQTILFLIGVQELGKGYQKFSKHEKQDLMHIATCRLLSQWGYYELEGLDQDGWPHWISKSKLPHLTLFQQEQLLRQSVIEYFKENSLAV